MTAHPDLMVMPTLERDPLPYVVLGKQSEDEEAWLRERTKGISASVVPEILGLFPPAWIEKGYKRTRSQVLRDLAANKWDTRVDSPHMECGQRCEPMVIEWVNDLTYYDYKPWGELLQSREWPWMLATPDAQALTLRGQELLEVKCTAPAYRRGQHPWGDAENPDGVVPEYVRAQVMAQLAVTGYPSAQVAHWAWGRRPELFPVARNERLIAAIVSECRGAWEEVEECRRKTGGGE